MSLFTRLKTSLYRACYRHLCRRKYLVAATHGCEFVLWPENYVDRRIWIEGVYEPEQIATLLSLAAESKPDLFLDVGANIGLYSCIIGKNTDIPALHSFECDPRNVAFLNTHLHMNGLQGRAQMHAVAAGDGDGVVDLHLAAATSTGKSSIVAASTSHAQVIKVAQKALDDVIDARGQTILIKMDVEGYEAVALKGMTRLLNENRCILQVEILPGETAQQTIAFLTGLGYQRLKTIEHDYYFRNF